MSNGLTKSKGEDVRAVGSTVEGNADGKAPFTFAFLISEGADVVAAGGEAVANVVEELLKALRDLSYPAAW
jgi:hypothetical protein